MTSFAGAMGMYGEMSTGANWAFCMALVWMRILMMASTCAAMEYALDFGFRLILWVAVVSAGFEVSSSGGSFFGKGASCRLVQSDFQIGSSSSVSTSSPFASG